MKKLFLSCVLMLTGCAVASVTYTGETAADNLLKSDTEKNIGVFFRAAYNCYPEKIHTTIDRILQSDSVEETWRVTGCNHTETFKVKFVPDGVGGTYFQLHKVNNSEK